MQSALRLLFVSCLALALLGCGEMSEGPADLDAAATGLSSSCENACGGQADSGTCWCDALCSEYGDCCEDKVAVCDGHDLPPPPSCEAACGGESPSGDCWCDDACVTYGDCCADKASVCDATEPGTDAPKASCEDACGGESPSGGCWCDALCEQYGDCCADKVDLCDGGTEPSPEPEPEPTECVKSGCSGQVCADEEVITTCAWQPWYVCYEQAACEVQADGACGFTEDEAFEACMAEHGAL